MLGITGEVETEAIFLFDHRGPRTSPAIEVQGWLDPSPVGEPYTDPANPGLHSIGVALPDVGAAVERLAGHGYAAIASIDRDDDNGPLVASVWGPRGVVVDLVEDRSLGSGTSRLHHLRASCTALHRSVEWYRRLGFEVLDGAAAGLPSIAGPVRRAVLRLPDEPFALLLFEGAGGAGKPYAQANHRGLYRFAVAVDDAHGTVDRVEAAGAPIDRRPVLVELPGTNVSAMWIAVLRDPDGVPVELVQRPRGAFR